MRMIGAEQRVSIVRQDCLSDSCVRIAGNIIAVLEALQIRLP